MKKLVGFIASAMVIAAGISVSAAYEEVTLSSPDGGLTARIAADGNGIRYNMSLDGQEIIADSAMGLEGEGIENGIYVEDVRISAVDEEYPMISGKASVYRNHYNGAEIQLSGNTTIFARCYDDGFAFSYMTDRDTKVIDEKTTFCVPDDCAAYSAEYERCYESRYTKGTLNGMNGLYGTPLLMEYGGTYMMIGEADLTSAYCGSAIRADGTNTLYLDFEPKQTDPVYLAAYTRTPWRVIAAGSAAQIADTQIFENLCPPCRITDTSWIKPGVSSWTWFNGDPTNDPAVYKSYVDFAVEMGWEYILLDEGWQPLVSNDGGRKSYGGVYYWARDVIDYAASRGIGVFVWSTYWDLDMPDKRERLREWAQMGIKGVKIDFFDSETQGMMTLYDVLAKECADLKLMVNFHGCNKPTGLRRTYPNLITCEAVHGTEHFLSGDGYGATAEHNTILPFTRNAAGPMDYTPAITDYCDKHYFTDAHKAALAVVFESGVQTFSDKPMNYRNSVYYDFFRNIPEAWEETVTLDAKPGEYVVTMRRKGDTYYVGSICNSQRSARIDMSFLKEGLYLCEIFSDEGNSICAVRRGDTITIPQELHGGAALRIKPWTGIYSGNRAWYMILQ